MTTNAIARKGGEGANFLQVVEGSGCDCVYRHQNMTASDLPVYLNAHQIQFVPGPCDMLYAYTKEQLAALKKEVAREAWEAAREREASGYWTDLETNNENAGTYHDTSKYKIKSFTDYWQQKETK